MLSRLLKRTFALPVRSLASATPLGTFPLLITSKYPLANKFFSTASAGSTRTHGNLKDQDRIFTNLYGDGDPYLKGAQKRVRSPAFEFP